MPIHGPMQSIWEEKGKVCWKTSVKINLIVSLMRFGITMETELWVCAWGLPGLGLLKWEGPT